MATQTSSIDDLLMTGKTDEQPAAPEHQPDMDNDYDDVPDSSYDDEPSKPELELDGSSYEDKEESEPEGEDESEGGETDEYGNEKPKPRMYTEEEHREILNKIIRERVAQFQRNNPQQGPQQTPQQIQQMAQDFDSHYDENSDVPWQQQLENFVEQTFNKIITRQQKQHQLQQEAAAHNQFIEKFTQGMERFPDFVDVVSRQPVTDHMTYAMRGIADPAAFIYAASKRHPEELQRISSIPDPYAQIVEMGRLEERMKRKPQATKAPKPVSRTKDDGQLKIKDKKQGDSIEDLIAQSEARKLAKMRQLRRR